MLRPGVVDVGKKLVSDLGAAISYVKFDYSSFSAPSIKPMALPINATFLFGQPMMLHLCQTFAK